MHHIVCLVTFSVQPLKPFDQLTMKLFSAFEFDRNAIKHVTLISLKREFSEKPLEGECIFLKLRTSPADANSSVHELSVPFFKSETPKE